MIKIRVRPVPCYEGTKTLDGQIYKLKIWWSPLESLWIMDLYGVTNSVRILGAALLPGKDILGIYGYSDILGELWVVDTSGADEDPNFEDMGTRWELQYTPIGG